MKKSRKLIFVDSFLPAFCSFSAIVHYLLENSLFYLTGELSNVSQEV